MSKWLALLLVCVLPCPAPAQVLSAPADTSSVTATAAYPSSAPAPASAAAPAPVTLTEDTSVKSLFAMVPPAFARLGRAEPVGVFALTGAVAAVLSSRDQEMTRYAADSTRFEHNLLAGHFMGDIYFQGSVALGTYVAGRALRSPRVTLFGAHLVRAQLLSGFVTDVTKLVAQRQRPNGANFSFPSGHTTSAFATAAVIQRHFGWRAGVPAYALGAYVAVSRMADNRHYPSDLLVGAVVGVVSARAVMVGFGRQQFAVTPLATKGGGGVALSLVK